MSASGPSGTLVYCSGFLERLQFLILKKGIFLLTIAIKKKQKNISLTSTSSNILRLARVF